MIVNGRQYVFDFRPPDAPMYSGAHTIADANALAQYYGNLGVDRFTAGDLEGAYRYYQRGLAADPNATQLWINVGVVFARHRQFEDAGRVYRQALALEPGNLSALNNLGLLEQQLGHRYSAHRYAKRVERYRSQNPYFRYWQGEQRLLASDAPGALQEFTKAVHMLPGEADFHFALARTYLQLGDRPAADASYGAALELASADSVRQRYRTEYGALTGGI
jgi:Flp pilus assembly protein TadD